MKVLYPLLCKNDPNMDAIFLFVETHSTSALDVVFGSGSVL